MAFQFVHIARARATRNDKTQKVGISMSSFGFEENSFDLVVFTGKTWISFTRQKWIVDSLKFFLFFDFFSVGRNKTHI